MGTSIVQADSEVYLFGKLGESATFEVFVNGVNVCDLNGPVKKSLDGNGMFKTPFLVRHPSYRIINIKKEGKVIISVETTHLNCMTLAKTVFKTEIQLDLENGETYFLELAGRSLKGLNLKPLPEKNAEKNLSSKKWKELPSITVSL